MILNNFNLSDDSKNSIGINEKNERTFNGKDYKMLNNKRKNLDSQFKSLVKEKDLLPYYLFKPIQININNNSRFKIKKDDLNKFFINSEEKKLHKEVYNTDLYNLINPYYLTQEVNYIKQKYISQSILNTFRTEKERLKDRENAILINNKINCRNQSCEIPQKTDEKNRISNERMLNQAVKEHCFIIKLINEEDEFKKILLLRPDFTIEELKLIIKCIYKKEKEINIENINLYYNNNLYVEVIINNNNETIRELAKEMNSELELEIFIQTQY